VLDPYDIEEHVRYVAIYGGVGVRLILCCYGVFPAHPGEFTILANYPIPSPYWPFWFDISRLKH